MASRILSRRRLLPFVRRMNDRYQAGWVHEDICRRLEKFSEDVEKGLSPRLMLLMPPRHGKSELASKNFPAWHLGRCPDHEFIACSYNLSLAMGFSRKVKQIIDDPAYKSVFEHTRLDPSNQSTEEWAVHGRRGGYVAAGIGGPITGKGAHCVPAGTMVQTTAGGIDIAHLYQLKHLPEIVTPLGPKRAMAITRREEGELYTLRFASGESLTTTGAHPIYLPDSARYVTAQELYGQAKGTDRLDVRVVRLAVPARPVQPQQVVEPQLHGVLLQQGVQPGAPRGEERQAVPDVLDAGSGSGALARSEVLLAGMPAVAGALRGEDLPGVQRGVSAGAFTTGLLRGDLRELGALDPYAWGGELALQGRQFLRVLVRPDESAGTRAGQVLRGVLDDEAAGVPPHRREPAQQHAGELDHAVLDAPHGAPQVEADTLLLVERHSGSPVCVYDLQVEDAGCFFADEVLTGNCLVIDDPVKNAEEADSADAREKIWEWYLSTAYTRLAPGGGVLVIQTWWHDDDLAGRLQLMMAEADGDPDVDQFEVVKYPAIAEADEYLDDDGSIFRPDTPDAPVSPTFRKLRSKGEALHPDRYDLAKLNKIRALNRKGGGADGRWWSALYQQNPTPDDGAYFLKEQFRIAATPAKQRCNVFIAWDFAISEKKQNDYTVGSVGLQDEDDMLHVAEVLRFKSGDSLFIVDSILDLTKRWYHPGLLLGFEDGQIFRAIESLLKKRMAEKKFYPPYTVLKPITDKMARARPLQGRMQQGKVSFAQGAEWYETVRNEMLRFPAGLHDDCVDSLGWMTQLAIGREPPRKPAAEKVKSWKDKLRTIGQGSRSHMSA